MEKDGLKNVLGNVMYLWLYIVNVMNKMFEIFWGKNRCILEKKNGFKFLVFWENKMEE